MKYIKASEQKTTEWAFGKTTELFIYPPNCNVGNRDFDIRLSTATCESKGSIFSDFTGYHRYIMGIDNSLSLSINGEKHHLNAYEICSFCGSDAVVSNSVVTDFNVIYKKNICAAIAVYEPTENDPLMTYEAITILYSFESDINITSNGNNFVLKQGDVLIIAPDDGNCKITANGKIIAVTISNIC